MEKGRQYPTALLRQDPALNNHPMIHERRSKNIRSTPRRPALGIPGTEHQPRHPGMDHGPRAHDAGLKGDIQRSIEETIVAHGGSGGAQRHHLGMGAGIMVGNGPVPTLADGHAVLDDYGAHRYLALRLRALSVAQSMAHPMNVGFEYHA